MNQFPLKLRRGLLTLHANDVAYSVAQRFTTLLCNAPGYGYGGNATRLTNYNPDSLLVLRGMLQQVLWQLGGLARARSAIYDKHLPCSRGKKT